jgi:hypothetical protein
MGTRGTEMPETRTINVAPVDDAYRHLAVVEYAVELVASAAESCAEDDMNESEEISAEDHEAAMDLAIRIAHAIRATPAAVLALARIPATEAVVSEAEVTTAARALVNHLDAERGVPHGGWDAVDQGDQEDALDAARVVLAAAAQVRTAMAAASCEFPAGGVA